MLSKSRISLLQSLQHKKFRKEHGVFLVEGYKSVIEFIQSAYVIETIYHTPAITPKFRQISHKLNTVEISLTILDKISSLKTPADVIAVVKIPHWTVKSLVSLKNKFSLMLDGVQDPGNMGTIIRTADWFGINGIICSEDTVDVYNPKVVQATMGSLARINVQYTDIAAVLAKKEVPAYGALLNGTSIYHTTFGAEGLIVMGNEGNGLRPEIIEQVSHAVTIPRVGGAESLNVGIATAIFCSEINRNNLK